MAGHGPNPNPNLKHTRKCKCRQKKHFALKTNSTKALLIPLKRERESESARGRERGTDCCVPAATNLTQLDANVERNSEAKPSLCAELFGGLLYGQPDFSSVSVSVFSLEFVLSVDETLR